MNSVLPVCRSSYSLLYGTTPPEALLKAAAEYGCKTVILSDRNNLYGCYDFYYQALQNGQTAIIGAELSTALGDLILLCEDYTGFINLSRLISHYQLHEKPSTDILNEHRRNLICLADTDSTLETLRDIFGASLYIAVGYDKPSRAYRIATEKGMQSAAAPEVSFLRKDDYYTHRLLRAIDTGNLINNMPESTLAGKEEYLREPSWYDRFFSPYPTAIRNNREIAERCRLVFPLKKNILPDINIDGDHYTRLSDNALSGLRSRIQYLPGRYLSRLEYELSVIRHTGFVDYFLIVGELVEFCRARHIAALGRGSAAGSLVSYALGITQVDPINEGLYFERFLNEARSDCPDIDIDIDWRCRDRVINHIYKKYGAEHVAMIASYIRFQPRLALRETAKILGHMPEEIDRFMKRLPHVPFEQLEEEYSRLPAGTKSKLDWEKFRPAIMAAQKIAGLPRHLGIHPGGVVITPDPLTDYVPLERATKGIVVTQCDMYQAEKIGFVKIDILGQRGLAVIADCHKTISDAQGTPLEIPENDPETYKTLQKGKTIGVFQIESPGLRALLKDLRPTCLNDITLALALIRPGASESGMKQIFLDRFHDKEKTVYPHPCLSEILKETFGVFIYQEQVILAAQKAAGFNLPASDMLRRAITKKRKQKQGEQLKTRFLDGAAQNGLDETSAQNIFAQLEQFASFGFCKAHAATYGYLAYQSAYFKTHYPDIFMTAVLRNSGGYYPSSVYVAEARRLGVTIMPPDLNLSEENDKLCRGKIYLGIGRIRDITGSATEQIEKNKPFASLDDFLSRVEISKREMENLIKVGFFDSLDSSRPRLLWQYRLWGKNNGGRKSDFFGLTSISPSVKRMPLSLISRYDIFKVEDRILELSASFHPLTLFNGRSEIDFERIYKSQMNGPLTISGWLADRKKIRTRDGKAMVFLTFDSLQDTFEVVLFPDVYRRHAETIRFYRYLTAKGKLQFNNGHPALIADNIYPAPTGLKEAPYI